MNQLENQLEPVAKVRSASELARQQSKIRELAETVEAAGFLTLGEQAKILGLPRSTAWTIRRGSHQASGLSASVINRMLAARTLPLLVRVKILEYVQEKVAGLYGGSPRQCRRFADLLRLNDLEKSPQRHGVGNEFRPSDRGRTLQVLPAPLVETVPTAPPALETPNRTVECKCGNCGAVLMRVDWNKARPLMVHCISCGSYNLTDA
jgi:hypothetical protein